MKPEIVFGLESAAWPALLASESGSIIRANTEAMKVFGEALTGEKPPLSGIWSSENGGTYGQFLMLWEQAPTPTADLKFRTGEGKVEKFTAAICAFAKDSTKWFVIQLLPAVEPSPAPAPVTASVAPPKPSPPPPPPAGTPKLPEPPARPVAADAAGVALKQKLECALQLARTVSIDFNNALTSVLGHTSLLLDRTEAGHPWRHSLVEVEKSAARAAEIANELAVFSRQEKETRRLPPGDLNVLMSRCVDFFRNAPGQKIDWKVQPERDLLAARFDEAKIQQALTKILENAAQAFERDGRGQINVTTRNLALTEATQDREVKLAAGAYVCAEISDTGPGIDPEILPRIFEPFFTTRGKTHRGLGLALAYGIITNHGGGIAVSSQIGSGTSVRVYLPAEKELLRRVSDQDEHLHGIESILVVDDEEMILTMVETILSDYGYRVTTVASGQKALAVLAREGASVDLLVTDLVMPGMSGRELVERARQLDPRLRILCMSGYVLPADKQTGADYLQKPFTSRELLAAVKQTISSNISR